LKTKGHNIQVLLKLQEGQELSLVRSIKRVAHNVE